MASKLLAMRLPEEGEQCDIVFERLDDNGVTHVIYGDLGEHGWNQWGADQSILGDNVTLVMEWAAGKTAFAPPPAQVELSDMVIIRVPYTQEYRGTMFGVLDIRIKAGTPRELAERLRGLDFKVVETILRGDETDDTYEAEINWRSIEIDDEKFTLPKLSDKDDQIAVVGDWMYE
jgi:hypothetical protein